MSVAGENIGQPFLAIRHSALKQWQESPHKVLCPVCDEGIVVTTRVAPDALVNEIAWCLFCGQRIQWLDIDVLRRGD